MNRAETSPSSGPSGDRPIGRWRLLGWGAAALLLLLPLVAMQFTNEVNWTGSDFLVFGLMLAVAGGCVELAVRMTPNRAYRAGAALAVLAGFLMLWANAAVGIIGDESNPANLLFVGILAVGAVGALLARGRPSGMMRAMVAAAVAQVLVGIAVPLLGLGHIWPVTVLFTALWLTAAGLFHHASR